jgi:Domain of unknown function (DUF4328)
VLEQEVDVECSRCGSANSDGERWCGKCGWDLRPGTPSLPTPETREAAARSARWLAGHPEHAEAERALREHEEAESRRRAGVLPVGSPRPAMPPAHISEFRSLRLRGMLAARWLSFNVVVLAVSLVLAIWHLALIQDLPDSAAYDASWTRLELAALSALVVYLVGAAVFLLWFHRAYANLPTLGATGFRYGYGWAVGGWFVPILCFFRPKQIADHIWIGSDPDKLESPPDVDVGRVPAFLNLWWLLWVLGTIGESVYVTMPDKSLEQERTAVMVLAGAEAAQLAAGVLAIVFIRRLSRRQEERAGRLRARLGDA